MSQSITVRLYAAARSAAGGVSELQLPAAELDRVLNALSDAHPALAAVLPRCSFLLDGQAVRDPRAQLAPGSTLDVLPPFAGG